VRNCKYSCEPAIILQATAVNITVLALIWTIKQQEQLMMLLDIIGLENGQNRVRTLKNLRAEKDGTNMSR
jgi:hypothetical protein